MEGHRKKKKKNIIFPTVVVLIVLLAAYLAVSVYFQYHFFKGTRIGDIDCSYMTSEEVVKRLEDNVRTWYLQIIERENTIEHVTAEDIKLTFEIKDDIAALLKEQNSYGWLFGGESVYEVEMKTNYDANALEERLGTLNCLNEEKMTDDEPPELIYKDGGYILETPKAGTRVDIEKTKELIRQSVAGMEKDLNLEKEGCYVSAATMDEEKYGEILNSLNQYVNVTIALTFGGELEPVVIDADEISQWISVNEEPAIVFDMEAIEDFVGDIADDIETMGRRRSFTTSEGETVTISGGDYGWWIAKGTEAQAIVDDIKNGQNVERELNYLQRAASFGDSDLGDTYIEIDLNGQHLYCYKDGERITECDIISGASNTPTPTGVYRMRFMSRNYTFSRTYFDRTVAYWMVFYGSDVDSNIGLISCDWRSDFGGNTYRNNGTHGSIFIPMDAANIIYREIPNDIPVIIYKN